MRDRSMDALLAFTPHTMGYLHGFFEDAHERLLLMAIRDTGEVRLLAPALSEQQALRAGFTDVRVWRDGDDPTQLIRDMAQDWNLRSAMIGVDNRMPADVLLSCQEVLPAALFKPAGDILAGLKRVKDAREISSMRTAGQIADEAFRQICSEIRPGLTEREIASKLDTIMRKLGGKPTFAIVAAGAGSAEPHHLSEDIAVEAGQVLLLDFGCEVDHYQSDITRVVHLGPAGEKVRSIYRLVWEAHQAARRLIRPGIACEALDQAARKVISDAGYGEYFMHRLGHGIGMDGHEDPYIVEGNKLPLEPGHCFSIEPGIYLPGEFGIRIENIVAATMDGHDSLNDEPASEIIELDV